MDERITELEIRLTHMEDTIEVLNQSLVNHQKDYDNLLLQVEILEKRIKALSERNIAHESEETPPPHY